MLFKNVYIPRDVKNSIVTLEARKWTIFGVYETYKYFIVLLIVYYTYLLFTVCYLDIHNKVFMVGTTYKVSSPILLPAMGVPG